MRYFLNHSFSLTFSHRVALRFPSSGLSAKLRGLSTHLHVHCACTYSLPVTYSKFLGSTVEGTGLSSDAHAVCEK